MMEKFKEVSKKLKENWRDVCTGIVLVILLATFIMDEATGLISGAFLCCVKYLCSNSVPTNLTIQCSELIIKDKAAD